MILTILLIMYVIIYTCKYFLDEVIVCIYCPLPHLTKNGQNNPKLYFKTPSVKHLASPQSAQFCEDYGQLIVRFTVCHFFSKKFTLFFNAKNVNSTTKSVKLRHKWS